MKKQSILIGLSALIVFTSFPKVYAAEKSTSKEEVVYITTDANGSNNNTYVVNIFDGGEIVDYGIYKDLKVLNTVDKINQNGERISISTNAEKLYYQGTLQQNEIPWKISIKYYMDGKEYSPKKIAGKSGKLEIKLNISENEKYSGDFYKNYALQVNLSLDTEKSSDVIAEGATAVNVGNKKQLSYIVLPNKGLQTVIKANVKDFEMDGISINGMQLNLNVDIDEKELKDQVNEFINATTMLDNGASALRYGNIQLKDGSFTLAKGASQLNDGALNFDKGIISLQNGMIQIQSGINELNSKSNSLVDGSSKMKDALQQLQNALSPVSASTENIKKLSESSKQLKQGLENIYNGAVKIQNLTRVDQYKASMAQSGLNIDDLKNKNTAAISEIKNQIQSLQSQLGQVSNNPALSKEISKMIDNLKNTVGLLELNNGAIKGNENYLNSVSKGMDNFVVNLGKIKNQYELFDNSIQQLATELNNMSNNLSNLSSAVSQIVEQYKSMDTGINEYTKGVANLAVGYNKLMSGMSELVSGSKELQNGSKNLYNGTLQVYENISKLSDGASTLSNGTGKMKDEVSKMESNLNSKMDSLLSGISEQTEQVSFVSEKNKDVKTVQFVIKTDGIKIEEQSHEVNDEKENKQSFWDKLMALFK